MSQEEVKKTGGIKEKVAPKEDLSVKTTWTNPTYQKIQDEIGALVQSRLKYLRDGYEKRKDVNVGEAIKWVRAETEAFYSQLPTVIVSHLVKNNYLGDPKDAARIDWIDKKLAAGEITSEYDELHDEYVSTFKSVHDSEKDEWDSFRDMIDDYMTRELDS